MPFRIKSRNVCFRLINNSKNVEKSTDFISYSKKPVQKKGIVTSNILHMNACTIRVFQQ